MKVATSEDFGTLGAEHGEQQARALMREKLSAPGSAPDSLYERHMVQYLGAEEKRLRSLGADDAEVAAYGKAALASFSATMKSGTNTVACQVAGIRGNRKARRALGR